jgi:hypothetical protein
MHVRALEGEKGSAASMWLLERRRHQDYGPRQKIEYSDADSSLNVTKEERRASIDLLRSKIAAAEEEDEFPETSSST